MRLFVYLLYKKIFIKDINLSDNNLLSEYMAQYAVDYLNNVRLKSNPQFRFANVRSSGDFSSSLLKRADVELKHYLNTPEDFREDNVYLSIMAQSLK